MLTKLRGFYKPIFLSRKYPGRWLGYFGLMRLRLSTRFTRFAACVLGGWVWIAGDPAAIAQASAQEPVILTNTFDAVSGSLGTILTSESIGPDQPGPDQTLADLAGTSGLVRLGETNQWRFYAITNDAAFTNAAFILFDTNYAQLSASITNGASSLDVDLYVSTDPSLLDFSSAAFGAAAKSFGPGPDELVLESNAQPCAYYIAVKCESATAGGFGLAALFSELPFSETDTNGSTILRVTPLPAVVGAGEAPAQNLALAFAAPPSPLTPRRVVVSTTVSQSGDAALLADLRHSGRAVTLRDFSDDGPLTNRVFSFDDSLEKDIPGALQSAGPGTLGQFAGRSGSGPWVLRFLNLSGQATLRDTSIVIYPQQSAEAGIDASVFAGACRDEFVEVPPGATNIVLGTRLLAGSGPVQVAFAPVDYAGNTYNLVTLDSALTNGAVRVDPWSNPPIAPGLWRARICNSGSETADLALSFSSTTNSARDSVCRTRLGSAHAIADANMSTFALRVTNDGSIHSVEAGVRLVHPRLSDLALCLVSPQGTRVLLDSLRGGVSTNGMGHDIVVTNVFPVSSSGGPQVSTNRIDLKRTSGTITVNYSFYAIADSMRIYYETNLIYDSGLISGSGEANVTYGPGDDSFLKIVMNEGDNPDPDTAWFYTVTSVAPDYAFMTFSDGALPVKFAPEPFDSAPDGGYFSFANGPEQPLSRFEGEKAAGLWVLEIRDVAAGPEGAPAALLEFELGLVVRNHTPAPILVESGEPLNGSLAPGQVQWVRVNAAPWSAYATNQFTAAAPLTVVYATQPGSWIASEAITNTPLIADSSAGLAMIVVGGQPPLVPGVPYFLGVINMNNAAVPYSLRIDLDPTVVTLLNGTPFPRDGLAPGQCDYFNFAISDRALRAQFELSKLSGDMVLLLKKDLPLPTPANAQAVSDNPDAGAELITLRNDSGPVVLSPGNWFLCASNSSAAAVSYSATARYWAATGVPVLITNSVVLGNELCITWRSLPGAVYHIESTPDLVQPWLPASPAITAAGDSATHCVPITEPCAFFRVAEGLP